jgi:pyruvate/2-oxoglutarate dehydrogenase complex dihydrolipoamide acyltransferase (E2) component
MILFFWGIIFAVYHFFGYWATKAYPKANGIRKAIRIACWAPARDSTCYARYAIDYGKLEENLKNLNEKHKGKLVHPIKFNHVILKAIGMLLKSCPKEFGKIIFGKFVPMEDVGVSLLVNAGGKDLGALLVKKTDKLSLNQIAIQIKGKISPLKKNTDKRHNSMTYISNFVVSSIGIIIAEALAFILYNLSLPMPPMLLDINGFGSCVFTNVSGFNVDGVHEIYAPLVSLTRNICTLTTCTPRDEVVVDQETGKLQVKKLMNCCLTYDHRYQDGSGGPTMKAAFLDVVNNPEQYLFNDDE